MDIHILDYIYGDNLIPEEINSILRRQRYQIKDHSAVKLCGWVSKSFLEGKECYKSKFYGINTHRCIQSTPSVAWCQQSCIFCWRVLPSDLNMGSPELPKWKEPKEVAEDILKMHRTVLMGYKGILDRIGEEKFNEAINPKHVALSLSGEPTMYPYIDELIEVFHKLGMSTFLVSNGILTETIEKVNPTQLYISIDAYDLESYKRICGGTEKDWERILKTLELLKDKKRTCIRTTVIRNINDDLLKFKDIYEKSETNFIEIKSYMNVGYSRKRLDLSDMLKQEELLQMCKTLQENSNFEIEDDSRESRVVLLTNKNRKINPKIDFGF